MSKGFRRPTGRIDLKISRNRARDLVFGGGVPVLLALETAGTLKEVDCSGDVGAMCFKPGILFIRGLFLSRKAGNKCLGRLKGVHSVLMKCINYGGLGQRLVIVDELVELETECTWVCN
jgi:hypothetical protein